MPMQWARLVVLAIAVGTAAVFFFAVDLGGTVRGAVAWSSAVVVAIWSVPSWLMALLARTRLVVIAGGALLNLVSAALLVSMFRSESSTSAIGVVTIPPMLTLGVAVVLAVEGVVQRIRRPRTSP